MWNHSSLTLILFTLLLALSSCGSRKDMVYFQGDEALDNVDQYFELKIEPGDMLSVDVVGTDSQVAQPFNQVELVKQGNQITSYENGVPATYGYLVDADSTIGLPIIGKVPAAGKTRRELIAILEDSLRRYIEKPQISIRLLNFKVTVLGEVDNPGTFNIPNERVTILEAIGIANDLKITGERKNVLVIRHEDGKKMQYRIDLTSNEVFSSPVYYLKQNDVVYVEPNKRSRYDASLLRSTGGVIISATSLFISTIILITK